MSPTASDPHRRLYVKHRRLLHRRAQRPNDLLHESPAPGIFLRCRQVGIAERMVKLAAAHDAIRAHPRRHCIETGGQGSGNADTLTLFGDRSPATSASSSGGRQDDGAHAPFQQLLRDLGADALHGVEAAHVAHGDEQLIQEPADHPLAL